MGVLYVFGPIIAAPYIQGRLQNMVSDHLWAELRIGKLSYDFPFGVRVRDAALVARDGKGGTVDLIRAKEVELSLAEIPRKKRPLIISRVVIHEPSIHLIMTDDGLVGGKRLVKTPEERIASEEARTGEKVEIEPTEKHKPSDFFRLRKFDVREAKVMFQDRRDGRERPWVVWDTGLRFQASVGEFRHRQHPQKVHPLDASTPPTCSGRSSDVQSWPHFQRSLTRRHSLFRSSHCLWGRARTYLSPRSSPWRKSIIRVGGPAGER